jgi:hypothetical protein
MNEVLPWYIAGPLIGLIVPILLILREKPFGISSSYRFLGGLAFPKIPYFNYDFKSDAYQIHFALGLILAGLAGSFYCGDCISLSQSPTEKYELLSVGIYEVNHALQFLAGGILVGFGARYANGCTAGHCIMGGAQFAPASIVATVAFFIGGLIATYFVNPFLF